MSPWASLFLWASAPHKCNGAYGTALPPRGVMWLTPTLKAVRHTEGCGDGDHIRTTDRQTDMLVKTDSPLQVLLDTAEM